MLKWWTEPESVQTGLLSARCQNREGGLVWVPRAEVRLGSCRSHVRRKFRMLLMKWEAVAVVNHTWRPDSGHTYEVRSCACSGSATGPHDCKTIARSIRFFPLTLPHALPNYRVLFQDGISSKCTRKFFAVLYDFSITFTRKYITNY